ncbi:PREDICTED: uncharacterized protein LOC107353048 [Acropora digitifera]|uniref:uncharacterized protein LOC107353048 n=1 Tax=Acropora digitifera TaxID=70779 RepID=UPI00077A51EB|nr:PREDICTED: uncharacterized protein LOC107353048 [Acropora digitifera]
MHIIEPAPMVETSASSTLVKMNFIAFVALSLMSVQAAMAIHCYQCQPSPDEIMNYMQSKMAGNTSEPPCSNPTEVFDCSQDPNIGAVADSCFTASITLNFSNAGDFTLNILNCSVKSYCNTTKNFTCLMLDAVFQSVPFIDMAQCDASCCEGDRCNGPSAVNSTPSSSSEGSSANTGPSTSPGPTASALQCTKAPFNAAIFSVVSLVYLAITNLL